MRCARAIGSHCTRFAPARGSHKVRFATRTPEGSLLGSRHLGFAKVRVRALGSRTGVRERFAPTPFKGFAPPKGFAKGSRLHPPGVRTCKSASQQ